jgi:transcription elongation factor S-II
MNKYHLKKTKYILLKERVQMDMEKENEPKLAKTSAQLFKKELAAMKERAHIVEKMHKNIIDPKYLRMKVEESLYKILEDKKKSVNLEKSIFNYTVKLATNLSIPKSWENADFKKIYTKKARSVTGNLKNANNMDFKNKVKSGEHKVRDIPGMTNYEIFTELYKPIMEKIKQKELARLANNHEQEDGCGMFKCGKCKKSNTTYYSLQTRGADEPMTNYITCLVCANRWKD